MQYLCVKKLHSKNHEKLLTWWNEVQYIYLGILGRVGNVNYLPHLIFNVQNT